MSPSVDAIVNNKKGGDPVSSDFCKVRTLGANHAHPSKQPLMVAVSKG